MNGFSQMGDRDTTKTPAKNGFLCDFALCVKIGPFTCSGNNGISNIWKIFRGGILGAKAMNAEFVLICEHLRESADWIFPGQSRLVALKAKAKAQVPVG